MLTLKWSNDCNAVVDSKVQKLIDDILELHSKNGILTIEIGQEVVLTGFRAAVAEGKLQASEVVLEIKNNKILFNSMGRLSAYPPELDVMENYLNILLSVDSV